MADQEARRAADPQTPRDMIFRDHAPVSFQAARSLINLRVTDPAPTHERTRLVYAGSLVQATGTRREQVMIGQLRGGHCLALPEYRHRVGQGDSPVCTRCSEGAPGTLEHLFQCPASLNLRRRVFGECNPPLSVLATDPTAVTLYLRGLRLL